MVKYSSLLKIENQLVKALTSIGQSVLDLLSKIAKFDLLTSDKSAIWDRALSIGQSVLEILSKIAKFDLLTSDKSAILNRAISQNSRGDLLTHIHHL